MTPTEIKTDILKTLYRQYIMMPSTVVLLNDVTSMYGWDAKRTFQDLRNDGLINGYNHPVNQSLYYATLTNKGVKEIDPNHFTEHVQGVESYLVENDNNEVAVETVTNISEPTRLQNIMSELQSDPKFEVNFDKQTVRLRDDYYQENRNSSSFM